MLNLLPGMLKKEKILSSRDFQLYVEARPQESSFVLLYDANIRDYFAGHRMENSKVYMADAVLKDLVISCKSLELIVDNSLKLINCIFDCRLTITGNQDHAIEEIEIDNCIFTKELSISNIRKKQCGNISLYHTNAGSLSIVNLDCREILIHGCRLFMLSVHDVKSGAFEADNNEIRHFEISGYEFGKVDFDYSQIQLKSFLKRLKSKFLSAQLKPYDKLDFDMNLFEFKSYDTKDFFKEEVQFKTTLSTLNFLKDMTGISKDRDAFNSLLFLESFFTQKMPVRKIIIWLTGGFLKPGRFLVTGLGVFVLFAVLYMLGGMASADALYFSGITFTTIGYGDICPEGFIRILAVTEGMLGICITSAFLVALVKKYVD